MSDGTTSPPVVTIDQSPVSESEFRLHMRKDIALTYSDFMRKCPQQRGQRFWETPCRGEVPLESLRKKTLKRLVHVKTLQALAVDVGLIPAFSYEDLLVSWEQDNRERRATKQAGGVIYGPVQSEFRDYYDYIFSNMVIRLKDKLNATRFTADDETLRSYYRTIRSKFRYAPATHLTYLALAYMGERARREAVEQARAVAHRVQQGDSLEALGGSLRSAFYTELRYSSDDRILGEENPEHEIRRLAAGMVGGDVAVFNGKENSTVYVMHCKSREPDKIHAFEKVKKDVLWYYQKQQFEQLEERLRKEAQVRIEKPLYQKITVDLHS